jgi:ribose transport system permease protein
MSSMGGRALVRTMLPHLVWEAVLLVVLLFVIVAGRAAQPALFETRAAWLQWAVFGLMAAAMALSLRTATPNLAVSAFAAAGSVWFVDRVNGGSSVAVAGIVAVLFCLLLGLVLGAFVGLTGVPAWAASLGAFALLQALLFATHENGQRITTPTGALTTGDVTAWFLLFVIVSLAGAVAFAATSAGGVGGRQLATPAADVGGRQVVGFGSARLVSALIGLGGSSAAAGLAGVLLARRLQSAQPVAQIDLLLFALGAALLAGVSVYGLRGGIFGVVLASGILAVIVDWNALAGREPWSQLVVAGVAILVGLLVGYVIGLIGSRMSLRTAP